MNNRQANNGRRRGRGGQQRQGGGTGQQGNGNRIDNRARGNAAQLLEKYKNLAADAQRQGDRVNAEYYLQFADHYFRVLSESRARFEEQNPQARRPQEANDDGDEDFDFEADGNRDEQPREERQQRDYREPREGRGDREPREGRGDREPRETRDREPREERAREARDNREDRPREEREPRRNGRANGNNGYANGHQLEGEQGTQETHVEERQERPRRGRPRREAAVEAEAPASIDAAVLPPAFGADLSAPAEAPVKKPRRRKVAVEDAPVSEA